ncbi:hypothetical protein [Kribbella sp. NPDC049584]|uniref:hypothetical protein n=1 Tax=Kribbella sp. NPDC049584 TaxID=3154833 RepID=UPI003412C502
MKTQDRPLDEDDRAIADLAEIGDWKPISGPDGDQTGPAVVRAIVQRVTSATDWQPWPLNPGEQIDDVLASWGFTTKRGSTIVVFPGLAFADTRNSGWSAYEIGPDDIPAAEAGLDANWPAMFDLTRKHLGEPDYVGNDSSPTFLDEWAPGAGADRRHLAVWVRPGAQFHLFSSKPTRDPLTEAVGVTYAVYID